MWRHKRPGLLKGNSHKQATTAADRRCVPNHQRAPLSGGPNYGLRGLAFCRPKPKSLFACHRVFRLRSRAPVARPAAPSCPVTAANLKRSLRAQSPINSPSNACMALIERKPKTFRYPRNPSPARRTVFFTRTSNRLANDTAGPAGLSASCHKRVPASSRFVTRLRQAGTQRSRRVWCESSNRQLASGQNVHAENARKGRTQQWLVTGSSTMGRNYRLTGIVTGYPNFGWRRFSRASVPAWRLCATQKREPSPGRFSAPLERVAHNGKISRQ